MRTQVIGCGMKLNHKTESDIFSVAPHPGCLSQLILHHCFSFVMRTKVSCNIAYPVYGWFTEKNHFYFCLSPKGVA